MRIDGSWDSSLNNAHSLLSAVLPSGLAIPRYALFPLRVGNLVLAPHGSRQMSSGGPPSRLRPLRQRMLDPWLCALGIWVSTSFYR